MRGRLLTDSTAHGSSSDAAAAQLLADYLREHYRHLKVWCLETPGLRQLKLKSRFAPPLRYGLVEDRDKVVQHKVRFQNQHRRIMGNDITAPEVRFFVTFRKH